MKTLSVNIPEEANELEVKMTMAAILFEKGLLSSGQAADFASVTKEILYLMQVNTAHLCLAKLLRT